MCLEQYCVTAKNERYESKRAVNHENILKFLGRTHLDYSGRICLKLETVSLNESHWSDQSLIEIVLIRRGCKVLVRF